MVVSAPLVSTFFIVAYGPKLVTTGAELPALFPQSAQLSQNYPNPFNPRTMIRYSLAEPGFVSVEVYDMLGTRVSTLVSRFEQAGDFQVEWDAEDQPSGVYFCRLQTARYILTRSMLLVR